MVKKKNPYEQLTDTLYKIPQGFPITENGIHLRVLEWIFTPEEAELASKMKITGETLPKMSRRLRIPEDKLLEKLEIMHSKGQIHHMYSKKDEKKYALLPFVVGIFEEQLFRLDKEFAGLMEEWFHKTKADQIFSHQPALHRVVPVDRVIKYEMEVHSPNEAEEMLRSSKSWSVRDCICRTQQDLLETRKCKYPLSVCLSFSSRENKYDNDKNARAITLDEALRYLKEAEEAGLVHTSMNIDGHLGYICNCCSCCCGVFRGLLEYNQTGAIVPSEYKISINNELCIGCGKCVSRCQFDALEIINKKAITNEKCVGCGVCALVCSKDALVLVPREKTKLTKRPKSVVGWILKRAWKRKVNPLKVIL